MELGFRVWDVAGAAEPADISWSVTDRQLSSVTICRGSEVQQMPEHSTVSVSPGMAAIDPRYVIRTAALGTAEYLAAGSGQDPQDVVRLLAGFEPPSFRPINFHWAEVLSPALLADLGHGVHLLLPAGSDQPPPFCVAFRGAEIPSVVSTAPKAWPIELVTAAASQGQTGEPARR